MNNSFSKFVITLLIVLIVAFAIHVFILKTLEYPLFENKIVLSYLVNTILAISIFGFLFKMKNKYKEQLGFLFLAGSTFKFIVFFLLFYPSFKQDGDINKLEFASFFMPYLLCLILETSSLAKWLNKLD